MNEAINTTYEHIRSGGTGYYEQKRGLIAVWGGEAVQFLDGLITNNMKTLEEGSQMLAAFPNAQGRLLAIVRVLRQGDRYLFETEDATREKVFQNLFRFTFAGDFFVEDLSQQYAYVEMFGSPQAESPASASKGEPPASAGGIRFSGNSTTGTFVPLAEKDQFLKGLAATDAVNITDDVYETLRIESGIPLYGIDMDETTIVPELGLDDLISYNKGCYIGQEIIARIYFRGHVAKQLTGLTFSSPPYEGSVAGGRAGSLVGSELTSTDGKNAGRITSITYSRKLDRYIALAYVRYDHLAAETELKAADTTVIVTFLPFAG